MYETNTTDCSTFLDPETRAAMGQQALALAAAVGYFSAGIQYLILIFL